MPFDPTPAPKPARSRSGAHLDELRLLESALRKPMPEGKQWDFRKTGPHRTVGCALCVAEWIGLIPHAPTGFRLLIHAVEVFGLSADETYRIFGTAETYGVDWNAVTPLMVADALAAVIAREEADTPAAVGLDR